MTTEAPKPFFIVRLMVGASAQKREKPVRHATREAAEAEARRLAAKFPGQLFVAFEALAGFQTEMLTATAAEAAT